MAKPYNGRAKFAIFTHYSNIAKKYTSVSDEGLIADMLQKRFISLPTLTLFILFAGFITGCSSSRKINNNYVYFRTGADTVPLTQKEILIKPNDILSIQVFSRTINQEQAAIFNLPNTSNGVIQGYVVSPAGIIEMPVIGSVKAGGLTRTLLQALLMQKLTDYVKNPAVLVRFLQFNVNVLGEVKAPGMQKFLTDRVTVLDAIGSAGDLTDYGKREDVTVIREEQGDKIYRTIDLRSKTIFESPVYVLQPNDIVYVAPNKIKLKNLSIDPDAQRKTGLFFTVFSALVSIATLVVFSVSR